MVRQVLRFELETWWSSLTLLEFHIIILQQVNHDGFDFVCRKKSPVTRVSHFLAYAVPPRLQGGMLQQKLDLPRTCVPSIPKCHTIRIRCDILSLAILSSIRLSQLRKSEPIKLFGLGIKLWIHCNSLRRYTNLSVGWNREAVREGVVFRDHSFESDCSIVSTNGSGAFHGETTYSEVGD